MVDVKRGQPDDDRAGRLLRRPNAIVQTNCYIDNDQVDDWRCGIPAIVTGDNTADNIADFVAATRVSISNFRTFAGLNWKVDVVEGDYYDINRRDAADIYLLRQ